MDRAKLPNHVRRIVAEQAVTDLHTHCYTPAFGHSADGTGKGLLLWGIDELVTYHYLVAEVFRVVPATELSYEVFWKMSKREQADHIWKHLFVESTPISEACRGVLTCLKKLGLDPNERTLEPYRRWFAEQDVNGYIDKVMELANVDSITMTNPVFDDDERSLWEKRPGVGDDSRFEAVLRIDPLLRDWPGAAGTMAKLGYDVAETFSQRTIDETRRFLGDWLDRMKAVYVATSLPPEFRFPSLGNSGKAGEYADTFIEKCLMPVLAERGLAWAMMIGCTQQVNPALKDAGDMVGRADVMSVVNLCRRFPDNRFMVTMLSRENQHELCVAARKFGNLLLFGCWWFMNNPSIIEEITRERLELLGPTFAPQHSDARVLDQLLYKWEHSRAILADVLAEKYADLMDTGFELTKAHVRRDARLLLRENYRRFAGV